MTKANSDQILDSFLGECLGDVSPNRVTIESLHHIDVTPAMSERLQVAAQDAKRDKFRSTSGNYVPHKVTPKRKKTHRATSIRNTQESRISSDESSLWSRGLYLLSGIAAGVGIAIVSWNFLAGSDDDELGTFAQSSTQSTGIKEEISSKVSPELSTKNSSAQEPVPLGTDQVPMIASESFSQPWAPSVAIAEKPALESNTPETLSMEKLPFSIANSDKLSKPDSVVTRPEGKSNLRPSQDLMKPKELVAMIDDQLEYMWNQRAVMPASSISDEQWLERASVRLLGRIVSQNEKEIFLKDSLESRKENWLETVTNSDDFYKFWTNRLTNALLPKVEPGEVSNAVAQRTRFKQWLASRLQKSIPVNQITKEILTASGSLSQTQSSFSPQAYWWYQLAQNNGHARVTDSIVTNLLGQRGTCIRCHEANTVALKEYRSSRSKENIERADYWNIASIVSGVEVQVSESSELPPPKPDDSIVELEESSSQGKITDVTVRYKSDWKPLFYEQPDRSLVAAVAQLPNDQSLQPPSDKKDKNVDSIRRNLEDLSQWVTDSQSFDERQVNWIWEVIIGQPLVNRFTMVDSDGAIERQELLESLAAQFRKSGYDLNQLVRAIVLTKSFDRELISADPGWYITSTPEALAEYQSRQRLFASYSAAMDPALRSMENVAQWFARSNTTVLGQSTPMQWKGNPAKAGASNNPQAKTDSLPEVTAAQTQFILRSRVLPEGLSSEVDRWLESTMSWEDLVDHAFYLSQDAAASKEEQNAARELLSSTRDRKQALQRILASQLP